MRKLIIGSTVLFGALFMIGCGDDSDATTNVTQAVSSVEQCKGTFSCTIAGEDPTRTELASNNGVCFRRHRPSRRRPRDGRRHRCRYDVAHDERWLRYLHHGCWVSELHVNRSEPEQQLASESEPEARGQEVMRGRRGELFWPPPLDLRHSPGMLLQLVRVRVRGQLGRVLHVQVREQLRASGGVLLAVTQRPSNPSVAFG
jgi:hypothetical protein